MALSIGIGLTNACDLACAHCYRDPHSLDELSLEQVLGVCDALPIRSVNLGTGENGLHPRYAEIVETLRGRGVKLSLTSNGFTIDESSDETLRAFREVEVSIDFPTASAQDAFRGPGNWKRVMGAIARARRLDLTVTVLSVMMKPNYRLLPEIARVAFAAGANYRVNVYQPVQTDAFTLSYRYPPAGTTTPRAIAKSSGRSSYCFVAVTLTTSPLLKSTPNRPDATRSSSTAPVASVM